MPTTQLSRGTFLLIFDFTEPEEKLLKYSVCFRIKIIITRKSKTKFWNLILWNNIQYDQHNYLIGRGFDDESTERNLHISADNQSANQGTAYSLREVSLSELLM